jgi:putative transposase
LPRDVSELKKLVEPQLFTTMRQAELLGISRASVYTEPRPLPPATLAALSAIDEIHTRIPFYGQRRLIQELETEYGIYAGRDAVRTLMRILRIEAIYPKPNTSEPHPGHTIYPYLLRGVTAAYPNHIWGTDITYIRLRAGFCYLVVFIDWYSRKVLGWRLSSTMDTTFCIDAFRDALLLGTPDICNSDQGSQFTGDQFVTEVLSHGTIKISMNGRGRCLDNIFTERLWRSVKYEDVYIKGYETIEDARKGLTEYFEFYNSKRRHQSLDGRTPNEVYAEIITKKPANAQGDLSTGSV